MKEGARPGAMLRGRYTVQNPWLWHALRAVDGVLSRLVKREGPQVDERPRRVLIAMGGHLGDVVIASSMLEIVRAGWPDAEIGVLIGSWSRPVIAGHPLVRWIHTVDHWKLNRSVTGLARRVARYVETRRAALEEVRAVAYDVAIDLHPFFPNSVALLRAAGIPHRVGYESGGLGPLLTRPLPFHDTDRHMAESHLELLQAAGVRWVAPPVPRYSLPDPRPHRAAPSTEAGGEEPYVVVHMGAGLALKEWPADRWAEVARRLCGAGYSVAFTGSGSGQHAAADAVAAGLTKARNLCDSQSWAEFVETIRGAALVVSVDSVAAHLAAGVGTPAVVVATGMSNIHHWRPLDAVSEVVSHPVPCAPCYRSSGCGAMTCIRALPVERVWEAISAQLPRVAPRTPVAS